MKKTSTMEGVRKLLITLIIIGVVVGIGPAMSETQASVLNTVAQAMLYSNAAVHVSRALGGSGVVEKIRKNLGGSSGSTSADTGDSKKPWKSE